MASQENRKRKVVGITLADEQRDLLKRLASRTGIPASRIIERALAIMLPAFDKDPSQMFREEPGANPE